MFSECLDDAYQCEPVVTSQPPFWLSHTEEYFINIVVDTSRRGRTTLFYNSMEIVTILDIRAYVTVIRHVCNFAKSF